jgi:acylpyruvate hydrolase
VKLATIRTGTGTAAVRVDDDAAVELGAADLGEFLARPDWRSAA